jgi:hypothetical protein
VKRALAKLSALGSWVWGFMGDPKTKNAAILVLVVMSAFGILAPEDATRLRDMVLSLAF